MPLDAAALSEAKTDAKTRKQEGAAPRPQSRTALMYLGPNRPYDLPLMHGQVCIGDTPLAFCAEKTKTCPHFAQCFVPVARAGAAMQELKTPGTALARNTAQVTRETSELRQAAAKAGK